MKNQVNTVQRYRVKPNKVEAINLECERDFDTAALWCGGKVRATQPLFDGDLDVSIQIPNLDSEPLIARRGMTIIKAADGGFGIIDTKVFLETYETDISTRRNGVRAPSSDLLGLLPEGYTGQVDGEDAQEGGSSLG